MNGPVCAICGEENLSKLRNEKARAAAKARVAKKKKEAAIKFALSSRSRPTGRCSCCGKSVPKSELKLYSRGKYYGVFPSELCPACFKEKNLERDLQVADQSLREATRAFDSLKREYGIFKNLSTRLWWILPVAGFLTGSLLTSLFLNLK